MAFRVIEPRRLYQEIALQIKAHIESGEFPIGSQLPAERDLARQFKVSRPSFAAQWHRRLSALLGAGSIWSSHLQSPY